MATAYSSNLALALPVTGELSGTWGTTVNTQITNMLDEALGYQAYSATGGADTITIPDGTTGVARSIYIQLNGTGGGSVAVPTTKTKMYFVFNNTASAITFKVTGQTGVSIPAAAKMALVSNGTDIIVAENYFSALTLGAALPVASGGTGLSSGTSGGVLAYTATGTLASSAALAANALVVGGGAGAAPSTTTTGTGVVTALGVNVGTAGAFVVNGGALGSPSSVGTMPAFTLGGTVSGGGNQINNVVIGTTTPLAGAFTTVSATGTVSASSGGIQINAVGAARNIFTNTVDGTDDGYVIITPGSSATTSRGGYFAVAGNENSTFGNGGNAVITTGNVSGAKLKLQFNETDVAVVSTTGLAVTGTLSATGTLSGGTSGTGYSFSGSAPATSLTLDASGNLGIGTSSPAVRLDVVGQSKLVYDTGATNTGDQTVVAVGATTSGAYASSYGAGLQFQIINSSGGYAGSRIVSRLNADNNTANLIFQARNYGFSDSMTLDSSGNLGIGTATQVSRISAAGSSATDFKALTLRNSSGTVGSTAVLNFEASSGTEGDAAVTAAQIKGIREGAGTNGALAFWTSLSGTSAERARIDSSGNLGLGVTPYAWYSGSSAKVVQNNNGSFYADSANSISLASNWGFTAVAAQQYISNGFATRYIQSSGQHIWNTAASGTGGDPISFTQAMTLDASGNLLVGATSVLTSGKFSLQADLSTANAITMKDSGTTYGVSSYYTLYQNSAGSTVGGIGHTATTSLGINATTDLQFFTAATERARIDSSGNLLVGTTSSTFLADSGGFIVYPTSTGETNFVVKHDTGTGSGATYASFTYATSSIGNITQNGTTGVLYNLTSDYRLKNNPQSLTGAREFVMALQPKKWQWWDGSGEGVGFVAHEFMEVAKYSGHGTKDAVDTDGKPIMQSIQPSSSEVMANLVSLIQEQQALITQLTARITALETA